MTFLAATEQSAKRDRASDDVHSYLTPADLATAIMENAALRKQFRDQVISHRASWAARMVQGVCCLGMGLFMYPMVEQQAGMAGTDVVGGGGGMGLLGAGAGGAAGAGAGDVRAIAADALKKAFDLGAIRYLNHALGSSSFSNNRVRPFCIALLDDAVAAIIKFFDESRSDDQLFRTRHEAAAMARARQQKHNVGHRAHRRHRYDFLEDFMALVALLCRTNPQTAVQFWEGSASSPVSTFVPRAGQYMGASVPFLTLYVDMLSAMALGPPVVDRER